MARLTKAQIKAAADRAEARSRGAIDDDDAGSERGFDETCDKASRERSREIIEAEIERLALLTPIDYQIERKAAAGRLEIAVTALDKLVSAQRPKTAVKKSAAPEIDPDELQRAAGHIIRHPDILSLFATEFSKVIAGEAANGKLLYLVATSRLFDKTMNAAIKGTSAGGKSEIRKCVLEFFPPESVVSFTSLSEKALIYYDGDFAHKILSMGEAAATDEQKFQDYLLRELMTERRIKYPTVQKVGGELLAVTIEKEGPVTFLVTTTKSKLHPENETRMLSLEIDDSEKQTRSVLGKVAQVEGLNLSAAQVDYKHWQDFQRWLELGERRVVVPFAAEMASLIPPAAVRLRRDFGQVLRAIKAHALLHREQRGRDDAGQIIADIEHDYAIARELLNPILAEGSGVAINEAMAETIDAVAKATIGMTEAEGANSKTIAKLLKLDQSATWRRLWGACADGHIVNLEQRYRMPGKYRVAGQKPETSTILPGTAELIGRFTTPPPETVHTCIRDAIADISLEDNVCKDVCTPAAYDSAYDKPLNGDENSPAYARMLEFSGDTDALQQVCQHCGAPATADSPIQRCAVGGKEFLLHRDCQADWLNETNGDLGIPEFLRRTPRGQS